MHCHPRSMHLKKALPNISLFKDYISKLLYLTEQGQHVYISLFHLVKLSLPTKSQGNKVEQGKGLVDISL